jgi:hypothetical protein
MTNRQVIALALKELIKDIQSEINKGVATDTDFDILYASKEALNEFKPSIFNPPPDSL